ncbi:myosin light chain kinase, smooth muscle-like isoform X2 [Stegostoma tigrinum]|uniref:myosin light chain kinase, smooth muscle-like isoform X2 n=1 Tax=Stegostoma tigrinum TaxID=3053191 RepID=UPI00287049D7|nr:myosin light chain kinase, smooth muscle-like isoform X2 [Stegostoma tigrinum]
MSYVSTFHIRLQKPRQQPADRQAAEKGTSSANVGTGARRSDADSINAECPVFTQPLTDVTVDESSTITLQAKVTGSSPITITWYLNGQTAKFGKSSFSNGVAQWVVEDCLPEDAGIYGCVAENVAGRTCCSATVTVRDFETLQRLHLPKEMRNTNCDGRISDSQTIFEENHHGAGAKAEMAQFSTLNFNIQGDQQSPKNRNLPKDSSPSRKKLSSKPEPPQLMDPQTYSEVKAGQQAELYVGVVGTPPIAAIWLKQKDQILNSSRTSVDTTDTGTKLVIKDVQMDDAGNYTLVVKDRNGSVQHQISLAVVDRPEPPSGRPRVSEICGSSLSLSWSGPCYDGGSAIQSYIIEIKQTGESEWRRLTDSCSSTSYQVNGLKLDREYSFRIYAMNSCGISEVGEESKPVKLIEDIKEKEEKEELGTHVTINTTQKLTDLYIQQECLGVGTFGKVYKLLQKSTGKTRAGKFYKARTIKDKKSARDEIEIMNCLHHPKLVQCLDAFESRTEIVMVMEYISGGELFERIVDEDFELTEPTCVLYVRQILAGLQFMHQQSIVHLDLKPENIVCVDKNGTLIKIIDFGLARKLDCNGSMKVMFGTPEFVAPEVINYDPIGFTTDTWSIGVICYILLSGLSPFQGDSDTETLTNVTAVSWEFDEEAFAEISENAKNFISSLLQKNMRRRLTCEDCLNHPWLQSTEQGVAKTLSKERMKRFLAKQKWKKAGKALLALKRLALPLNKPDNAESAPTSQDKNVLSPTHQQEVLSSLDEQIQRKPFFSKGLTDLEELEGSASCLQCHIEGYPDPEVIWYKNEDPITESSHFQIDYQEDGSCSLIIMNVTQVDSGYYTCKAMNALGEETSSATLTVYSLDVTQCS